MQLTEVDRTAWVVLPRLDQAAWSTSLLERGAILAETTIYAGNELYRRRRAPPSRLPSRHAPPDRYLSRYSWA